MSLFSFLHKNEQESAADDGSYYSRAEEASTATRARKRKPSPRRDDPMDPVLPEKKRARRRLVGAVALVLAAIIGLPMILDSEPRQPAADIAIQIPARDSLPPVVQAQPASQDETSAAASLDEGEEVVALGPRVPMPAATSAAPTVAPTAAQVEPAKPAAATTATPTSIGAKPPTPTPAEADARPAAASSAEKPATPTRADESARALALLEGRPDPRAANKSAEKFVIQVAALATQEKVNELRGTLKRAGIDSYTQKVATAGGEATRIRVGPFASREEAEKMRSRIAKLGLNGKLVPA